MPRQPAIPLEIQAEVLKLVEEFNRKILKEVNPILRMPMGDDVFRGYGARFKGKFLYLDRLEHRKPSPICRLAWIGSMDKWDFAIYKYSDEHYDPEEWFFTGAEKVDGTITGEMEAEKAAYPI